MSQPATYPLPSLAAPSEAAARPRMLTIDVVRGLAMVSWLSTTRASFGALRQCGPKT
jgi:uncharacterized membrane protein